VLLSALREPDAAQCGYCLSGIVASAVALLEGRPNPSRAEINDALDKHLCRCGAHPRIIDAIFRAAAALAGGAA
jgi:aerobic-type carbon monoxide dehydrogenase small subunit (CoxS/CutS family)